MSSVQAGGRAHLCHAALWQRGGCCWHYLCVAKAVHEMTRADHWRRPVTSFGVPAPEVRGHWYLYDIRLMIIGPDGDRSTPGWYLRFWRIEENLCQKLISGRQIKSGHIKINLENRRFLSKVIQNDNKLPILAS